MSKESAETIYQRVDLFPGTMGLAGLCVEALGADRVQPNSWTQPVTILNVTQEELDVVLELVKEKGVFLTARLCNPI